MTGESWIFWSDSIWFYRVVCFGLLAVLGVQVVWPAARPSSGWFGSVIFLLTLCAFVVMARWPGLFYPRGFNPDEDQLLAAARALVLDPVFFRAAEAGSSGPLNVYPLLASLAVGAWPTLFSARLVGLGVICVALVAVYFAGRAVFSEPVARLGAVMPGAFFGLTNFWDFTHYTSEHVPMALLAVGWALSAWAIFRAGLSYRQRVVLACLAACVFSMVPFAKLQASMAAVGSATILVAGILFQGGSMRSRLAGVVCVCAAGVVAPVAFVGFFAATGALEYFWMSYIQNAVAYQGSGYQGVSTFRMLGMILFAKPPMRPDDFLWYAGGWAGLVAMGCVLLVFARRSSAPWRLWGFLVYSLVLIGLAVWTVDAPQRNYPHYLLFLPVAMGFVAMALIGVLDAKLAAWRPAWLAMGIGLFFLIGVGPMAFARIQTPNSWSGLAGSWAEQKPDPISQKILEIFHSSGVAKARLCVWGYNPTYYTQTGVPQATRLSTSSAIFNQNPLRPFFLETYMEDLRRVRPYLFVDAVAPEQFVMMTNRDEHGHEVVPEVRDFVAENYQLAAEIDGVRIYQRKVGNP